MAESLQAVSQLSTEHTCCQRKTHKLMLALQGQRCRQGRLGRSAEGATPRLSASSTLVPETQQPSQSTSQQVHTSCHTEHSRGWLRAGYWIQSSRVQRTAVGASASASGGPANAQDVEQLKVHDEAMTHTHNAHHDRLSVTPACHAPTWPGRMASCGAPRCPHMHPCMQQYASLPHLPCSHIL